MKISNKIKVLTGLTFIVTFFFSCSFKLENDITVTLKHNFPVIEFKNTLAKELIISPSDENTGSIGYVSNKKKIWVQGQPKITKISENELSYSWNSSDETQVVLSISNLKTDLEVSLKTLPENIQVDKWLLNISASENEYFTGIFERVVDGNQKNSWADNIQTALNLRGEKVDVKLKPTVSAYAPFYLSSNNYGIFVHGTWPGHIDFCKDDEKLVMISFEGPQFNFKIYTSDHPMDIVRKHALESGPSFVPPKWAFGQWRWRDEHFNKKKYYDNTLKKAPYNTDIVEDILLMEAFDIPVTAQWIDRPWCPGKSGFDDYIFDTVKFPHPEQMIKWINSKNQELMIWIGPWVMGNMAKHAKENNFELQSKIHHNETGQVLVDFSNPDAVKWWGENGPGKLAKMGIKGFKLDRADGEKLLDSLHLKAYNGKSFRENFNDYPHQYVKATFDAVQPVLGNDFVLFPRAQYTGSARYGAMWAGDTDGKPEGLRSAIIAMQRCSVMGYPIWGSDIGGYWGQFSRESTMRWIAFGCFSPIMETGPTNNLGFWSNPNEPFYDIELIATWRLYSKTRMKLIDYLNDLAIKANADGTPIARPLFLVYPEQPESWSDWQTYLLGPDILVSAIWKDEAVEHELFLPKGEVWIDAWNTEKEYEGGKFIKIEAPLYKIPLYIRKGSTIQLGNLKEIYSESLKIASEKPDLAELEKKENW
jgi:alpha-glucosidase (family GH31 glycosyl hydrolase)